MQPLPLLSHFDEGGSGRPLVFLHGLGAGKDQTVQALSGLPGIRLIAPDLPGHGQSLLSDHRGPISFAAFAARVQDLIRAQNLHRPALGGLSMGAGIALKLTQQDRSAFGPICLLRPAWTDRTHPPHLRLVATIADAWTDARSAPAALEADPQFQTLSRQTPLAAEGLLALARGGRERCDPLVLRSMFADRPIDRLQDLQPLDGPIQILATSQDALHPLEIAAELGRAIPNASLEVLPPRYIEPSSHRQALRQAVLTLLEGRNA